jgi:hypothetical protein
MLSLVILTLSPKARAFSAIMYFPAFSYVTPFTSKWERHHGDRKPHSFEVSGSQKKTTSALISFLAMTLGLVGLARGFDLDLAGVLDLATALRLTFGMFAIPTETR